MAGGGDELKLLATWFSPFASRVKFVFHLKGLSYENVEEDLKNKSELLLESNPVHKKVPVLFHNGKPLCESMVIVEYIDEIFAGVGPSIVPADPYERAIARFWVSYIDNKLVAPWFQVFRGKTKEEKAEGLQQMFVATAVMEEAFRECSKGKPFFGGDAVGIVDVALGSQLGWLRASEALSGIKLFDPAKTPLLLAWAERFTALDAAKASMPESGRLLAYAKMRQAETDAANASK
uniref:Glutathione S-transferase n=1 Tax=Oryza punctata TaxID=4537 RepID=A0A0E0MA21_ORYPU